MGLKSLYFTIELSDDMLFTANNIEIMTRNLATLWLFKAKILHKLIKHPDDYVLLNSRLSNKEATVAEVKSNLENVRQNYRPSRLHTLHEK